MNILVTAGNTSVPIDRVRCITNIFTGRTGTRIALYAHESGHTVELLTSHPEVVAELGGPGSPAADRWAVHAYRSFDDLQQAMERGLKPDRFDVVIHSAAVSDYRAAGIYAPAAHTCFHAQTGHWQSTTAETPSLVDRAADKVRSSEPELWLRLIRMPKLIDRVRDEWGFRGILVKFKLEVGVSEEELRDIAELSRLHSGADLMVANTLEGASSWALLGPFGKSYQRISRLELAPCLLDAVERLHKERVHG